MKPPRFTFRTMLVAVVLAALATKGWMLWRRSAEFRARANEHYSRHGEIYCDDHMPWRHPERGFRGSAAEVAIHMRALRYELRMYETYRRAAFFPWLPVDPDPAPPHLCAGVVLKPATRAGAR